MMEMLEQECTGQEQSSDEVKYVIVHNTIRSIAAAWNIHFSSLYVARNENITLQVYTSSSDRWEVP
jgi:hypothetical protein